jgi:hypothetical protein
MTQRWCGQSRAALACARGWGLGLGRRHAAALTGDMERSDPTPTHDVQWEIFARQAVPLQAEQSAQLSWAGPIYFFPILNEFSNSSITFQMSSNMRMQNAILLMYKISQTWHGGR